MLRQGALTFSRLWRLSYFTIPTGDQKCLVYNILASYGQDRSRNERFVDRPDCTTMLLLLQEPRYGHASLPINDVVPLRIFPPVLQYDFTDYVLCTLDFHDKFLLFFFLFAILQQPFKDLLTCAWCGHDDSSSSIRCRHDRLRIQSVDQCRIPTPRNSSPENMSPATGRLLSLSRVPPWHALEDERLPVLSM